MNHKCLKWSRKACQAASERPKGCEVAQIGTQGAAGSALVSPAPVMWPGERNTIYLAKAPSRREPAQAATQATGLRRLVLRFLFLEEVCRGPLPVLPERAAFCRWPRVLAGSVAAVEPHKPRRRAAPPQTVARGRRWRWHWRSGDRPSYLSGPRRKEPRNAAERLLALETKFLLFWVGQERDSVLSRSPAPRFDCSGLHERNLPVATLWPSPTSGTLGGRRLRACRVCDRGLRQVDQSIGEGLDLGAKGRVCAGNR
jgi:hypothetical protein